MIKLVLSDMDNTLIWYGGDGATKRTVDAIHACQAEGVIFGPATGRNPLEVAGFLRRDEICVFGDAENDLAMFEQVTHSCAVANASPEVAAAARWHIGAANEEGVAIALEQIAEAARESRRQGAEVLPAFMKEGESPHDR